jgi:hypothetical protein
MMNRRNLLALSATLLVTAPLLANAAWAQQVDVNAILNDPDAPVGGNPKGDVTIVAYLDYNCIYCKKSAPDLDRVVKEDGKIRLISTRTGRFSASPPCLELSWRSAPSIRAATRRRITL